MPPCQGYKQLLIFIDTFTGWIEALPTCTERASEVAKVLLKEIIPRFGQPQTLQCDNGPTFISQVTKGIVQALRIKHIYFQLGDLKFSGKVERANQIIK
jgi:hypothetical protein